MDKWCKKINERYLKSLEVHDFKNDKILKAKKLLQFILDNAYVYTSSTVNMLVTLALNELYKEFDD